MQGIVHNGNPGKKQSGKLVVELWRNLGHKYSAIPVVLCHTHVETGNPVEQHVPLAKV